MKLPTAGTPLKILSNIGEWLGPSALRGSRNMDVLGEKAIRGTKSFVGNHPLITSGTALGATYGLGAYRNSGDAEHAGHTVQYDEKGQPVYSVPNPPQGGTTPASNWLMDNKAGLIGMIAGAALGGSIGGEYAAIAALAGGVITAGITSFMMDDKGVLASTATPATPQDSNTAKSSNAPAQEQQLAQSHDEQPSSGLSAEVSKPKPKSKGL